MSARTVIIIHAEQPLAAALARRVTDTGKVRLAMPGSDINNRIPQIGGNDPLAPSPAPQGPQTPGAQASGGTGADATTFIPQNAAAQPTVVAPMQVAHGAHRRPGGAHGAGAQRAAGMTTPAGAPAPGNPEGAHGSEKKPRRGKGHAARNVIIALALLLVIAYAGGVIAFTFLFYPHTSLAGVDISWQTSGAAAEKLEGAVAGYTLTVADEDLGFTWTYTPEDGRNIFNVEAAAQRRLAQNEPWAWPVRLYQALTDTPAAAAATAEEVGEPDLSLLGAAFDRTAFETSLGEAIDTFNAGRGGAFTAQTAWDAEQGLFVPEKAYESRRLNRDAIISGALTALGDLEATFELADLGEDLYLPLDGEPAPEDMQADCDAANAFLGTNVTFKLGDSVAATLDASVIGPWITFDAQTEPTLNQDAVTQWAHNLAAQMNTVGTERTYTRPDGKTVTVSGGTFGWSVDEAALVQSVQDAVANHQTGEIAVPASSEGDTYAGAGQPDWKKYVDVDITEQHARLYDENGNLIWETGVVTGLDNGSDDTPTGVYKVNYKARNINLVSPDKDPETGEPEYISPVEYWIAWKGNAWGFHDASWQPDWVFSDPSAYHTYGSHGCINTPYDKVQQLYDLLQEGDCVVVHY